MLCGDFEIEESQNNMGEDHGYRGKIAKRSSHIREHHHSTGGEHES